MNILSKELMGICNKVLAEEILTRQEHMELIDWLLDARDFRLELAPEDVKDWCEASRFVRSVLQLAMYQEDPYEQTIAE